MVYEFFLANVTQHPPFSVLVIMDPDVNFNFNFESINQSINFCSISIFNFQFNQFQFSIFKFVFEKMPKKRILYVALLLLSRINSLYFYFCLDIPYDYEENRKALR